MRIYALGFALIAGLAACSRPVDFLYRLREQTTQEISHVHKLKELQGENKVDILWIIDNSGSMMSHHQALIQNADVFINQFVTTGGLEWKMGIVSTAVAEEPYVGFTPSTLLTYQTPDNVRVFKEAVADLGTSGDAFEKTFAPLEQHLTDYPDFTRKNAVLAVIMVTDAPEQSRIPASRIVNFLTGLKGDLRRVVTYGVFASNDFNCRDTDEPWDYAGSPYEELITATQGVTFKLCADFGQSLADMGKDLVSRVKRPFIQLYERPLEASLRVVYKGKDLPGGPLESRGMWLYDFNHNRIVFHSLDFAPSDNEEVTVVYEIPST